MRSAREILVRLRQEVRNLWLLLAPPSFQGEIPWPLPLLSADQAELDLKAADEILAHRLRLFGHIVETGPAIHWRRDYLNQKETGTDYFRLIPYLDVARAGDHKNIWELNRHQHLVTLAKAFVAAGNAAYLREIEQELASWWEQNPFQRGVNWASALEVAFRAFSWIWVYQLIGAAMTPSLRQRLLSSLYQHGAHLENNLSYYFSPNTHLLGEAVVLHALGALFPQFPKAARWQSLGAAVTRVQMERQVHDDGSHFEQSSYYHGYALEMFRFHASIAKTDEAYLQKLERMQTYLDCVRGPSLRVPLLGDDDGGYWLHGITHAATIMPESRFFPDAGLAVMYGEKNKIVIDAGPFGPGRAGHSHADTLSLVVTSGDEEILIDPGTFTYVGDPHWRNWFRGTAAHNTICINGLDQAIPAGPFGWREMPEVRMIEWRSSADEDVLEAECRYAGFTHRRKVRFQKPSLLFVEDEVVGPAGEHDLEQRWHLGSERVREFFTVSGKAELVSEWRSREFGSKEPAPVLVVRRRTTLPTQFTTLIALP